MRNTEKTIIFSLSKIVTNFFEADLTSLGNSVYTRPVLVRGSTIVKTFLVVTYNNAQPLGIYMNSMALVDAVMSA